MTTTTITVEHDGKKYAGQIGTVKSTSLGYEDHGILSAWLHVEWPGGGIGVGGYCLDKPAEDHKREGSAYGLDHIIRMIETVGASSWEKIPGKQVIVLYAGDYAGPGSMSVGIASTTGDRVLILKDHAASWRERAEAEAASA